MLYYCTIFMLKDQYLGKLLKVGIEKLEMLEMLIIQFCLHGNSTTYVLRTYTYTLYSYNMCKYMIDKPLI